MTPTTPSPISDQAAGERFAITVWKDGSWKQWQSGDAVYAESDPDWLTTIRPTAPPAASAPTGCVVIEEADMVPHVHPEYGVGLFVTDDCVNKMNGRASASPAASVPASISDTQILEAFEAAGVQWQSVRTLANDHEYMTRGSQPAKNLIDGARAILAASMGGDRT